MELYLLKRKVWERVFFFFLNPTGSVCIIFIFKSKTGKHGIQPLVLKTDGVESLPSLEALHVLRSCFHASSSHTCDSVLWLGLRLGSRETGAPS